MARIGYPNRMPYAHFLQRYSLLDKQLLEQDFEDNRKSSEVLLRSLKIDHTMYKLGRRQVFMRAGFIDELDQMRNAKIETTIDALQTVCRVKVERIKFQEKRQIWNGVRSIQRNWRCFMKNKANDWISLTQKIKPLGSKSLV